MGATEQDTRTELRRHCEDHPDHQDRIGARQMTEADLNAWHHNAHRAANGIMIKEGHLTVDWSVPEPEPDPPEPEWTWPDGALVCQNRNGRLVQLERTHMANRYGVYYLQFPEAGQRLGGSSWAPAGTNFHEPASFEELLDLHLYETAARVRELEAMLTIAVADREAVRRHAEYHGRTIRRQFDQ